MAVEDELLPHVTGVVRYRSSAKILRCSNNSGASDGNIFLGMSINILLFIFGYELFSLYQGSVFYKYGYH